MKLTILSSTESYQYDVSYLEVETSVGNFVILEGHAPLLLLIAPKKPVTYCTFENPESLERLTAMHGGILQVNRSQATLILNQ